MSQENQVIEAEPTPTEEFVSGLRALADFYATRPSLPVPSSPEIMLSYFPEGETLALAKRIAKGLGTFDRTTSGSLLYLKKSFGTVGLTFVLYQDRICTRTVVKTKDVTELVPNPEAPKVEVTRTVEEVRWDCPSLLAPELPESLPRGPGRRDSVLTV